MGLDSSEEMLALAGRKRSGADLLQGDATQLNYKDRHFDHVASIRFLDLIPEDAMRAAMSEFCRVAKSTVTVTIRFGKKYVPKSNTAEHNHDKFFALVASLGFECAEKVPIFDAGWHVLHLRRKR